MITQLIKPMKPDSFFPLDSIYIPNLKSE